GNEREANPRGSFLRTQSSTLDVPRQRDMCSTGLQMWCLHPARNLSWNLRLAQALQLLPGEGAMSSGIATLDRQAAVLAAQAHMALSEVLSVQQSRSGRQRQRAPWHLEKARSALHRASSGVASSVRFTGRAGVQQLRMPS
ncbi:unnamed protein product, partial [Effrenium voratum]